MASTEPGEGAIWRAESREFGRGDILALLAWTAVIAFFFWDLVTFQKTLFYFDISEINYPYRDFLAKEFAKGRFSRWIPGLYCGLPLFSESQAGYLHPLKYFLYPWMDTWKAFNLDNVLSVWLTGLGTYGWLRRHVNPRGSLAGAGVFALSGFFWAHFIHTSMNNALTSVPFIVWATEWAWDRGRLAGVALGALAVAFQVFAGHLQDTLLTAGLLGAYALFRTATERGWRAKLQVLGIAAGVIGLGAAIASVQWIPSKELLDRSPRAGGLTWNELTYGSWSPELLPTLIFREAYGTRARDTDWMDGYYPYHEMNAYLGLSALVLATIGATAYRDRWVAFWVVLAVVGSLLMLGRFTSIFDYANRIPVIGSSRIPVRFHFWVSLAAAALAGVGVDRLDRGFQVKLRLPLAAAFLLVFASIIILLCVYSPLFTGAGRVTNAYHEVRGRWLGKEFTTGAIRTLVVGIAGILSLVIASRTSSTRMRGFACSALPLIVMADLLSAHWRDIPLIEPAYWTDPPLSARILKSDPSLIRLYGESMHESGEPGYASEPIDFMAIRDPLDWSLPPVWGLASSSGETPIFPKRMHEYREHTRIGKGRFDVEGVSHVLTNRRANVFSTPSEAAGSAFISRNPNALPRARLMGRPVYADDEAGAVAAIEKLGEGIRGRVVVEDPGRPLPVDSSVSGTATITLDEPEQVVVETSSGQAAYLVLADSYDPGWRATVDGESASIRPAWLAFRAVYLAAGRHKVIFRYRPAGFMTGLAISLGSLVLALAIILIPAGLAATRPAHDSLDWPRRWPVYALATAVLIILGSTIKIDANGEIKISSRWQGSFHTQTWGTHREMLRARSGRGFPIH